MRETRRAIAGQDYCERVTGSNLSQFACHPWKNVLIISGSRNTSEPICLLFLQIGISIRRMEKIDRIFRNNTA